MHAPNPFKHIHCWVHGAWRDEAKAYFTTTYKVSIREGKKKVGERDMISYLKTSMSVVNFMPGDEVKWILKTELNGWKSVKHACDSHAACIVLTIQLGTTVPKDK